MHITEEKYNKYLEEINDLMDKDPDPSTLEGERIFLLALALKEYESKNFSFYKPTAVEAIRFRMEEQNLKQKDLIPYIGSKSKVSELLSGKSKSNLTVSMIRKLNQCLGIPLEILVQENKQSTSEINLEEGGWSNFPFKEMAKRGWISLSKKVFDAKEIMADFLKPIGGISLKAVMWRRSLHNREEGKGSNKYELMAWVAKIMILAEQIKVKSYDKKTITREYLRDLAKLSRFANGPLLAKEMLQQNGIKLIFLEKLSKTKVDGGCFLDRRGHPVIGMTLRYDRLDNFWHTLLHEMAHVYKHLDGENQFIDNLDSLNSDNPFEKEADDLAREALIPEASWKKRDNLRSSLAIEAFAKHLNIHPAIVAGRIRFETKNYAKFGKLVGQGQVRKLVGEHLQF